MQTFRSLSFDSFTAPSKASSPQSVIYYFLVQFPVSSPFLQAKFSKRFWSRNTFILVIIHGTHTYVFCSLLFHTKHSAQTDPLETKLKVIFKSLHTNSIL
jgi:hypothetical protein